MSGDGARDGAWRVSEATESELVEICERRFARLQELQNELILCEPDFCSSQQDQVVNRLGATEAELRQRQTEEPKLLPENPEILLQAGREEMLKLCSQLEMVLSCCQAERDKLRETKELEQKWLEEKTQALAAATDRLEQLKKEKEKEKTSKPAAVQDIKEKIGKVKVHQEALLECLGDVLENHIPLPKKEPSAGRKKTKPEYEITENLISLHEIVELLMNKALRSPHDPYVQISEAFWPPYTELLLRYGIAVRHQENHFKIRLGIFV